MIVLENRMEIKEIRPRGHIPSAPPPGSANTFLRAYEQLEVLCNQLLFTAPSPQETGSVFVTPIHPLAIAKWSGCYELKRHFG